MFIYFWERQSASRGGAEGEGDIESEAGSKLHAVSTEPNVGLEIMNREIMTWAEVGCLTDWATQVTSSLCFLKCPFTTPTVGNLASNKNAYVFLFCPGNPSSSSLPWRYTSHSVKIHRYKVVRWSMVDNCKILATISVPAHRQWLNKLWYVHSMESYTAVERSMLWTDDKWFQGHMLSEKRKAHKSIWT